MKNQTSKADVSNWDKSGHFYFALTYIFAEITCINRKLEFVIESLYDDNYDTDKNYLYNGTCCL